MKAKCHYFGIYKERTNVWFCVFRMETATRETSLMHFQFQMKENGGKIRARGKKTTNKVRLMSLDAKALMQRQQLSFWIVLTNKQGAIYVFCL